MALRLKPETERVRCVYSDDPSNAMPEHKGKVFAVIGPFDGHMDKLELQDALRILIRGWNVRSELER